MPDITVPISYSADEITVIRSSTADPNFSFRDWSSSELEELRKAIRDYYKRKQVGKCAYCKNPVSLKSTGNCHIEHIAPKSLYPNFLFEPRNLCVICSDCNEIKRNQETLNETVDTVKNGTTRKIYPRSSNAFKVVHPHFDNYSDHIFKLTEYLFVDKSKKGHFTIGACNLNRRLYEYGWEKEIVDDGELNAIMSAYLEADDTTSRIHFLNKLKEMLLLM